LLVSKFVLLLLESSEKRTYLNPEYQNLPLETTSGIINRSFLWWINGLFVQGSRRLLSLKDLLDLDEVLTAERVSGRLREAWELRCKFGQPLEYPYRGETLKVNNTY